MVLHRITLTELGPSVNAEVTELPNSTCVQSGIFPLCCLKSRPSATLVGDA